MTTKDRLIALANKLEYKFISKKDAAAEIDSIVKDISTQISLQDFKADLVLWMIDNIDGMEPQTVGGLITIIKKIANK